MGPILRPGDQPRAYGVQPHIMGFGSEFGLGSEPMVEEIPLPDDPLPPGQPALQTGDLPSQPPGMAPTSDHMQMIGHDRTKPQLQPAGLLGLSQGRPDRLTGLRGRQGGLAGAAAANRHEPEVVGVDPRGATMGQRPAGRQHPDSMAPFGRRLSPMNPQRPAEGFLSR